MRGGTLCYTPAHLKAALFVSRSQEWFDVPQQVWPETAFHSRHFSNGSINRTVRVSSGKHFAKLLDLPPWSWDNGEIDCSQNSGEPFVKNIRKWFSVDAPAINKGYKWWLAQGWVSWRHKTHTKYTVFHIADPQFSKSLNHECSSCKFPQIQLDLAL